MACCYKLDDGIKGATMKDAQGNVIQPWKTLSKHMFSEDMKAIAEEDRKFFSEIAMEGWATAIRSTIHDLETNYKGLMEIANNHMLSEKSRIEAYRLASEITITISQIKMEGPHILATKSTEQVRNHEEKVGQLLGK